MNDQRLDICELAKLANIVLTEEEQLLFSRQFDSLFLFLDRISAVQPSMSEILGGDVALREDEARVDIPRSNLLSNAKSVEDGCITVPLLMEDL